MTHRQRNEQGVALVLALSFMVVIGLVTTALLSALMSSVEQRSVLDDVRNRQYAAEGGVEQAIASVRTAGCAPPYLSSLNAVPIRVECTDVPTITRTGFFQRNVVFTSCVNTNSACATPIVRAQVNYEALDADTPVVTKTYIQSWTVSR